MKLPEAVQGAVALMEAEVRAKRFSVPGALRYVAEAALLHAKPAKPVCNRCGGLGYVLMTDGLGGESRAPCTCPSRSEATQTWSPMWDLPDVTERTEMLFRREWVGRDGKTHASHEVLYLWPDGVITDFTEAVLEPEEIPSHWMALPACGTSARSSTEVK